MASLREELYMKVGELSGLKESSSRTNNTRLDMIRKLEAQLASEREESRKTVTALNSQLAFREADYQLIANELARIKETIVSSQYPATDDTNTKENVSEFLTQGMHVFFYCYILYTGA